MARYISVVGLAALVTLGIFLLMGRSINQEASISERKRAAPVTLVDLCAENKRLEFDLLALVDNSRSCNDRSQCSRISLGCPHGCRTAVNTEALAAIKQLRTTYFASQEHCTTCQYKCVSMSNARALCRDNKCVIENFPNSPSAPPEGVPVF